MCFKKKTILKITLYYNSKYTFYKIYIKLKLLNLVRPMTLSTSDDMD